MKIIITGATGKLGHMVAEKLIGRMKADQLGVSVRDVTKAGYLESLGVRVRHGDFSDVASLDHAFEGASQIFIVSPNATGEAAIQQHRAAIDAAKKAGAKRILYTSHIGASAHSAFPPMISHAAAEKHLQDCGVPFTSFRNGFYAESAVMMLSEAIQTGELRMPEDGPVAWTSHDDLAEAAAIVLSQGGIEGLSSNLTASEAIDFEKITEILSEILNRKIKRIIVPDNQFETSLITKKIPQERINIMMGLFRASRKGEFAKVDPALANLIGREPKTIHDFLKSSMSKNKSF